MTPNGQHTPAGGDANNPPPAGNTTVVAGRNHVGEVWEAGAEDYRQARYSAKQREPQ